MRAEIISSGTELLLGEVTDTNTPYLARELAVIGVNVYHHTTVGDNPQRLLETIQHAEKRANLVIISGGLGPTQDDITKDILADHLGLKLVADKESLTKIQDRYESEELSPGNYHQAQVIEGSKVLRNDVGSAAGMLVEHKDIKYALLPGPPNEFEHMTSKYLIPLLLEDLSGNYKLESRNLNFYGLPEATIAEELNDLIEKQVNPTIAIYAKKGIIDIRITARGATKEKNKELLDQTEIQIIDKIGKYFVGYDKTTFPEVIFKKLKTEKKTISVVEASTNSHLADFWKGNSVYSHMLKATFNFSAIEVAQNCFKMNHQLENSKTVLEQNENLARIMKKQLGTDYAVSISSWGKIKKENSIIPEKLYVSIVETEEKVLTKEINFNKRSYFADWVIPLKVSDFVRRYLLGLEQLEN